jgi:hypothetical protein
MTDQDKVIKLLDELNIKYEVNGNTIYIDSFECDGADEFGISFWDGEDYPEGSYHEFWVVPCQQTLRSTPEVSLEDAQNLFDEWYAYTGECVKEHNWRFLGFIAWLGAVKKLSGSQIEEVIKLTSHTWGGVD